MRSNLLILGKAKIIFMIPMMNRSKRSPWLPLEELLNIYHLSFGRHMLLMGILGLPSIISINLMFLALVWF